MSTIRKIGLLVCMIHLLIPEALTQSGNNFRFKGYLSYMQTITFEDFQDPWIIDHLLHNRLNFYWTPLPSLKTSLQMRNRII